MSASIPGYQMTAVAVVIYGVDSGVQWVQGRKKMSTVPHEEGASCKQISCPTVAEKLNSMCNTIDGEVGVQRQ